MMDPTAPEHPYSPADDCTMQGENDSDRCSPPTTRSRKRAEAAAASQSIQSCKRPKEEMSMAGAEEDTNVDKVPSDEALDPNSPTKRKVPPSARRPKNEISPVTKLTVNIAHTYKMIRARHLQAREVKKKPSNVRSCHLWELLRKCSMIREISWSMHNGDVSDEEAQDRIVLFQQIQRVVSVWLHAHADEPDCMDVELLFSRCVLKNEPKSAFDLYARIDMFMQGVEKRKGATGSFEDSQGNYQAESGECLGLHDRYVVHGLIGGGAFCKCWLAVDRDTGKKVCIKLTCSRKHCFEQSRREVKTLRFLNTQHPDASIVKLLHSFVHCNHQALVFEPLAYDLYLLLKNESFKGLSLKLVRKFGIQILPTLVMLSASNGLNLIHCDLKPENIMVVDRKQTKINIIDFGSSCFGGEHGSTYIQSRFYRAPEVLIGCPYTTQIDMWSFGCILFELYTGRPLFNGKGPEDQLLKITALLGLPPTAMMDARRFFLPGTKEGERLEAQPKPVSFQDRFRAIGYACISRRKRGEGVALSDEIMTDSTGRVTDESLLQFIDLITRCLEIDPDKRFTPSKALRHKFWTTGQSNKHSPRQASDAVPPASNTTSTAPDGKEEGARDAVSHMTGVQMAMANATLNQEGEVIPMQTGGDDVVP